MLVVSQCSVFVMRGAGERKEGDLTNPKEAGRRLARPSACTTQLPMLRGIRQSTSAAAAERKERRLRGPGKGTQRT